MAPLLGSRPRNTSVSPPPCAPMLLTRDDALRDGIQRLAAAAGAPLDVTGTAEEARSRWAGAPVVLVGADVVVELAATAPTRRDRVHVVSGGTVPDSLFRAALDVGADSVVELPAAEAWLVETLADTADGLAAAGLVVGVVGGCGGAGATTFAAALATVAASGVHTATLVDADPLGAGIEEVLGFEDASGSVWGSLLESAGRLGSRSLRNALPRQGGLAVLGWGDGPRSGLEPSVVREVVSAAARGSDLVVLDLPRYADRATAELMLRCDHVLVVTTLEVAGVAAAARVTAGVLPVIRSVHLVARGPARALDPAQVADTLGVPLAAWMTDQRRLAESVGLGLGPVSSRRGPLARAARQVLTHLDAPMARAIPRRGAA